MDKLNFIKGELKIQYRSEKIALLPKEFELLYFLYQRPERVFTRDELLDAVWPMDTPTDRTVDDHIYRVRKKLQPLSSTVRIETVRGQGYRLILTKESTANPLLKDDQVYSHAKILFQKYHLYGQGDALKLLEENQAIFGFELDLHSSMYLHFMKGNFRWFLEEKEVSFWNKCYYLLHIYTYMEEDKQTCLQYFTRALNHKELPEPHHLEIKLLNRLTLLIFTKQVKRAEACLIRAKKQVYKQNLEGFIPFLAMTDLYLSFLVDSQAVTEAKLAETEKMLIDFPFSREKAGFSIIKGVYQLTLKNEQKARIYFDQGFNEFRQAKYIPGQLISLNIIRFFLTELGIKNDLAASYEKQWKQTAEQYHFNELRSRIKKQLDLYLK
ncbi:winged helix-turn-helix domain-containing protein [Halobacillus salinarum]|uniref:Winged helix-turn-helix domain-containing protein n=1 Tax=Halobacillus salinarum TaxID=2932257 RepID=A0ABY4EME3_9BACI|nr:winged helix-turn-helix domain-containing protein [Halobacillus salinarum]UOQ45623.1 winged helix-turn-helix domain-containing protein [Halobacillus salinarum]